MQYTSLSLLKRLDPLHLNPVTKTGQLLFGISFCYFLPNPIRYIFAPDYLMLSACKCMSGADCRLRMSHAPCKKAAWLGWPGPAQAGLGWPRQDMASLGRPGPAQASKNLKITLAWPGRGRPRPAQASQQL